MSHTKVGDVLVAQGDGAGALTAYRESLAIRERLAASDPSNASWQRDLSVSHTKVGDVLVAQGDGAGALTAYRESLAIRERLAASDPSNASWQRDLSVSQDRIGDVLRAQGDGAGALTAYRESLAIRERLVASDPSNAEWQRDLSISRQRIAVQRMLSWPGRIMHVCVGLSLGAAGVALGRWAPWLWIVGGPMILLSGLVLIRCAAANALFVIVKRRLRRKQRDE